MKLRDPKSHHNHILPLKLVDTGFRYWVKLWAKSKGKWRNTQWKQLVDINTGKSIIWKTANSVKMWLRMSTETFRKKCDSWVIFSTSRHSKKKKCQNNNASGISNEIFSYILWGCYTYKWLILIISAPNFSFSILRAPQTCLLLLSMSSLSLFVTDESS